MTIRMAGFSMLIVIIGAMTLQAQPLQITLQMNPRPSPFLSDWQTHRETASIQVFNPSTQIRRVRFDTRVSRDGQLKARTKFQSMPTLDIPPGASTYFCENIIPLNAVDFFGDDKNIATSTGKLPSNIYQICIALLSDTTSQPLTIDACRQFEIVSYQTPSLLQPTASAVYSCQQTATLLFRWTPVNPLPPTNSFFGYEFALFEVYAGQTPMQAFRSNLPIVRSTVAPASVCQFLFPSDVDITSLFTPIGSDTGAMVMRNFVWSVRTMDLERSVPLTEPDGWAEPSTFSISCPNTQGTVCACSGDVLGIGYAADSNPWLEYVGGPVFRVPGNSSDACTFTSSLSFWLTFAVNCIMPCVPTIDATWTITFTDASGATTTTSGKGMNISFSPPSSGTVVVHCTGSYYCDSKKCKDFDFSRTITITKGSGSISGGTTTTGGTTGTPTGGGTTAGPGSTPGTTTPGGGPPTTTERTKCGCECTCSAEIKDGKRGNGRFTYTGIGSGLCKTKPCPELSISGTSATYACSGTFTTKWILAAGADVVEMVSDAEFPNDITLICKKPGFFHLIFRVDVVCSDGSKCFCIADREEYCPPTDTFGIECSPPVISSLPGSPVSLGSMIYSPDEFPYPRAVPLRASAIDVDLGVVHCLPCRAGGMSVQKIPVPDGVSYHWKLSGKGSLRTMPGIQKANDIEKEIQEILKKIADATAVRDSLQHERDELPKRFEALQVDARDQMSALQPQIDSVSQRVRSLDDSISTWNKKITQKEQDIVDLKKQCDDLSKESKAHQKSLDSLDLVLRGKAGPDELAKLKEVHAQMEVVKKATSNRDAEQKKLTNLSSTDEKKIEAALSDVKSAQTAYESLRQSSSGNAKSIGVFQTQMYPTGPPRDYFQAQKDFSNKATTWMYQFGNGNSGIQSTLDAIEVYGDSSLSTLNSAQRTSLAATFNAKLSELSSQMTALCSAIADAASRSSCTSAKTTVIDAASTYSSRHAAVRATAFKLDKSLKTKIAASRNQIESKAAALAAAAAVAKAKADTYAQLIESVKAELSAQTEKVNAAEQTLETETNSLSSLQAQLKDLSDKREAELQAKRAALFDEAQSYQQKKRKSDSTIRADKDSLASMTTTLTHLHADVDHSNSVRAQLQVQLDKLNERKAILQKILDRKIDAELAALDKAIAAKDKEIETLKKQLIDKQKEKDKALEGNKEDDGEVVYYVPPPLEQIMTAEQKKMFEELKDSLKNAEAELEIALAAKQAAQKQLFLLLDRISRELIRYKDAVAAQADAEKELTDAGFDEAAAKNSAKKKQADAQAKAQKDVLDAEKDVKQKEENVKKYQDKVDVLKKDIETQNQKVEQVKKDLLTAAQKVKDMKAQLDKEKELEANAQRTQEERTADLDKAQEELKEANNKTGRAQSELNHAIASNDEPAATAAKANVESAQNDEKQAQTKVTQVQAQVASAATSVNSAALRVKNATTSYDDARAEFSKKAQQKIAEIDQLNDLNSKLEKDLAPRLENAQSLLDKSKESLEDTEAKRTELNDAINKGLDSLAFVKEQKEKMDGLKKDIENAKTNANEAKQSVTDALSDRDKILSSVDSALKATREKLLTARKKLHDYLLKIFEHIETTELTKEQLTITATDLAIDGWRSKDGPVVEVKPLTYSGRTPQFANTVPAGGGGGAKDQGECPLDHTFIPNGGVVGSDPTILSKEPRTIALIYKDGEPLWKEWPVIKDDGSILARDYTVLTSSAADPDLSIDKCGPSANGCIMKGSDSPIADFITYQWALDGGSVLGTTLQQVVWKAAEVDKPKCRKEVQHTVTYKGLSISPDPTLDKFMKPTVKAGVMVEVKTKIEGVINGTDTCVARVICGDHKGLAGEDIHLSVKPKAGYEKIAKDFGFEKKGTTDITKATDADGYVHVPFLFGSGLAEFDIVVEWKRDDGAKEKVIARTPIFLQFLRFAEGAPNVAFLAAEKLWKGSSDFDAAVASLPDRTEDPKKDPNYQKCTQAVVGLVDFNRDSLNGVSIEFLKKKNPAITLSDSKDQTHIFGFARTIVGNLPKGDKKAVFVEARCEDAAIRKLCTPEEVSEQKSGKLQRFKIGDKKMPFIVELDQPASANEKIYGKGKLIIESAHEFLQGLVNIPLKINGIVIEVTGTDTIAQSGFVSWNPSPAKTIEYKGFSFELDSVSITATMGAKIGGKVTQEKYIPEGAGYFAELESSGNFFGSVTDLPEIKFGKCTLKKGSSLSLDMHSTKDEDGLFDELKPFYGVVINKAELTLPPAFSTNNGKDTTASELSVENFAIGRKVAGGTVAIGGKVKISGKFFSLGFGGWKCSVSSLDLSFANSEIKEGTISGSLEMPIPFEGGLDVELKGSQDEWSGSVSTANPVSVPKIKTVFSILPGTAISYKPATALAQLTINATLTCEYFKRMDIRGLTIDNTGRIVGEVSIKDPNIKFGRGFDLSVSSLSIKKSDDEDLTLNVKGAFSIPNIIALKGGITLTTGPTVDVSLDEAKIKFEYGPCSFAGAFAFKSTEFRGEFDIGIKNLIPNGISGKLIAGIQTIDTTKTFTYWYAELSAGFAIPLGQTGLFITKIGGGVGYNYEPPIGNNQGNPKELPNSLAFKAIVGIGTPANGMVMNSRVEMVLIPWTNFSIYGKIWLLNKADALFGEGQLNLSTDPAQLDGYVRLFIGLPDAQGKVVSFDGKIGFMYSTSKKYIKSEKLNGVVLQVIKAEGVIEVTEEKTLIKGDLRYDFDKKIPLGVVDFYVSLHAYANAGFEYINAKSSLSASIGFKGSVDVKGDFPIWGMTTLLSGQTSVQADLNAAPGTVAIKASVHCSYSVFGYSDSLDLDVGYSS